MQNCSEMPFPAFAAPSVLPVRIQRAVSATTPRCVAEADKYFPAAKRNAAPHISFSGKSGVFLSMKRVEAFCNVDKSEQPLFEYGEKNWAADKPTAPNSIAWPGGDGRGVPMSGTRGSFTVGNDRGKFAFLCSVFAHVTMLCNERRFITERHRRAMRCVRQPVNVRNPSGGSIHGCVLVNAEKSF
jgi:hypothetical protein